MEANRGMRGEPISALTLALGVLATPAAWLLQICAGETLVSQACFPHDVPLLVPIAPSVRWAVIAMSGATLLVGLLGTWLAWRNWRRLSQARRHQTSESTDTKVEGDAFVTKVGLMASALFLFALVATDVATGLVSACT